MTRKEFEEKSFDDLIEVLLEERNDITTYDVLKEYAIHCINSDYMNLALHILNALYNSDNYFDTDIYQYDFCAGTCDTPKELNTKNDIEQFFDFTQEVIK